MNTFSFVTQHHLALKIKLQKAARRRTHPKYILTLFVGLEQGKIDTQRSA